MTTLGDVTRRLGDLLESRAAARAALDRAMWDVTYRHAARLEALGEVRVRALDPCPRCHGPVLAGDRVARCTRCDHTVAGNTAA